MQEHDINQNLGFAGEVRLTDHLLARAAGNEVPYFGEVDDYNVVLLEFPHGHVVPGSDKVVKWMFQQGIRPLIAHLERNRVMMRNHELMQPFIEAGCWLQLTAGSLTGDVGERARSTAEYFAGLHCPLIIASDSHNLRGRAPRLSRGAEVVRKRVEDERAQDILVERPCRIAASQFDNLMECRRHPDGNSMSEIS